MSRSLSPEQIRAKKADLVDAAIEILESDGHQALTVRNLADKAKMSRSTPYLYYENKDALLDAVCVRCFCDLTETATEIACNGHKSVIQMRELGEMYIRFGLDHPVLYELIFMATRPLKYLDVELQSAIDEYSRVTSKPLIKAYEDGLVILPPDRLNPVLWSASHGLLALHRLGHFNTGDDFDRIREDLGRVISSGFLTKKMEPMD